MNETMSPIVSSLIYRQIEPLETAAVATLACEVFDQFVAPYYQPEGVTEFHRYASADALSQRHVSGHTTYVAERGGELVGMLHLRAPCHVAMLFVQSSLQRSGIARAATRLCRRRKLRVYRELFSERRSCLRAFRLSSDWFGAVRSRHSFYPHAASLSQ
jgi:hypothetical protein